MRTIYEVLKLDLYDQEAIEEGIINTLNSISNKEEIIPLLESIMPTLIEYANIHHSSRSLAITLTKLINSNEYIKQLIDNNLIEYIKLINTKGLIKFVRDNETTFNIYERINNNFDEVISSIDIEALLSLYYLYGLDKVLSEDNKNKINTLVENNKYIFAKVIDGTNNIKEEKDISGIIIKLVDELLESQNLTYKDFSLLAKGTFSYVYQIGDKVLKIGDTRETHEIPNHKRILAPLIRIDLHSSNKMTGSIEVSNKVDTNVNLTEEELYKFYKELRDDGVIFGDLKNENLGYLLQDNTYHWNEPLGEDPKARGLEGSIEEILPAGELVIIDTDYIFKADDPGLFIPSELSYKFEMYYREHETHKKK